MPISKSAKKALRQSKRKNIVNKIVISKFRNVVKGFRQKPSQDKLTDVFSSLDKAVKKKLIHKNKANRLKKRLSRIIKK